MLGEPISSTGAVTKPQIRLTHLKNLMKMGRTNDSSWSRSQEELPEIKRQNHMPASDGPPTHPLKKH